MFGKEKHMVATKPATVGICKTTFGCYKPMLDRRMTIFGRKMLLLDTQMLSCGLMTVAFVQQMIHLV